MGGLHSFQEPVSTSITGLGLVSLQEPYNILAEHLSGSQNQLADKESRTDSDSSEWALDTQIFQRLMEMRGPCTVDLFASRFSFQHTSVGEWIQERKQYCSNTVVEQHQRLCLPPFLSNKQVLSSQNQSREGVLGTVDRWLHPYRNHKIGFLYFQRCEWNLKLYSRTTTTC